MTSNLTCFGSVRGLLALIGLVSAIGAAEAQPVNACDAGLVANIEYDTLDRSVKLAWLKTITRENFSERKASAGGSISYEGVDLGANYDDFEKKRDSLFQKEQYSETQETAIAKLRYVVPDFGRQKWLDCIEILSRQKYGLHVWVERENRYGADVRVVWNPTPPPKAAKLTAQTLIGGSVPGLKAGTWLPDGLQLQGSGSATALIQRDGEKEIRGTVTISGITERFYVPSVPRPRLSIAVSISGTATISRNYDETFNVLLKHHQCKDTRYWRPYQVCSADTRRRPTGIRSYGAVPIQGRLADFQCYQPIAASVSPGSAPNCTTVNILYNECHFRRDGVFPLACMRGLNEGTPIDIAISGGYDDTVALPQFVDSTAFGGSKRWVYPATSIPSGAKDIVLSHSATIVDLVTGKAIVLNNNNPDRGGFRLVVSDGGKTVVVLQEQNEAANPVNQILQSLGWDAPATQ